MTAGLSIGARHDLLADALEDAEERAELERQLPEYLKAQRWLGGQTRRLTATRIERWAPLGIPAGSVCLCVVSATDATGGTTEHQLWLAGGEPDGERRAVVDALGIGAVRSELLRLALAGGRLDGRGVSLSFELSGVDAEGCAGEGRVMGVEQSNTSVAYGEAAILKLYRKLEPGRNPEVELSNCLTTSTSFAATPKVLATGRLEGPGGYGADAALLQEYVANDGDGWEWALGAARAASAAVHDPRRMEGWLEAERETLRASVALGRTTARLHAALAGAGGEGLAPEPVGDRDLRGWVEATHGEARTALAALRDAGMGEPARESGVEKAVGVGLHLTSVSEAGLKTRVHGDYHLGQVLRTERGWAVVDFEGEPAAPLEERRALQHPLADVAGMMRSWNYAATTAFGESGEPIPEVILAWETPVAGNFLGAYLAEARASEQPFLPSGDDDLFALLSLFELRKALYEVRYELNNRPDWVWIPLAAVSRLTRRPGL